MKTIEQLALEQYPVHLINDDEFQKYDCNVRFRNAFIKGYLKASETLYTEKEVIEAIKKVTLHYNSFHIDMKGGVNIEYLADIEITLKSLKNENS